MRAVTTGIAMTGALYLLHRRWANSVPANSVLIYSSVAAASSPVLLKRLWIDSGFGGFDRTGPVAPRSER